MKESGISLMGAEGPVMPAAWWQGARVERERFLRHVARVAAVLPDARYLINLCEDRYLFTVVFAAALVRDQINLLPPSRAPRVVEELSGDYPGCHHVLDETLPSLDHEDSAAAPAELEALDPARIACIIFTSGSTGRPRPNPKRWRDLVTGSHMLQSRFGLGPQSGASVVATVPPQHMFGLETSVLLQLTGGAMVHGDRPFFPEDVRLALASMPAPRTLVTTPVHLRACAGAGLSWPQIERIISATAPLSVEAAAAAEQALGAPVLEIYGCTEGGSLATRRTVSEEVWRVYDRMQLLGEGESFSLAGPQLPQPLPLNDRIERIDSERFRLLGRNEDLINVAGKRGSLGDLNLKLLSIPGVEDGVFYVREGLSGQTARVGALVVAPQTSRKEIHAQLAQMVDAAFLPRPLYFVDRLPRNETGKLPNAALEMLLASLEG